MRVILALSLALNTLLSIGQQDAKIQGTWELKSYINHSEGSSEWESYGENIIYQKHIAGAHFAWIRFNTTTKKLEGMGGGSYKIDKNGNYVENLDFFYPPGSSELGQAIPFTMNFKGKNWMHTGYAKVMDVGMEGESRVVDSVKIEEIWKPVKAKNKMTDLVGAWELMKYQENPGAGYMTYPEMIGYIKIITGSHFVWVKYDKEGDQIFAAGSGTYSRNSGEYTEDVQMIYPDATLIGETINFKCKMEGHLWKHYGTAAKNEDVIDEYWAPKMKDSGKNIFD